MGVVADYQGNFNAWKLFIFDSIDEGLQVAATAGDENAQAQWRPGRFAWFVLRVLRVRTIPRGALICIATHSC